MAYWLSSYVPATDSVAGTVNVKPGIAASENDDCAVNVKYINAGFDESDVSTGTPVGAFTESVRIADPDPAGRCIVPP